MCRLALATLDVIERDGLVERAEQVGGLLLDHMVSLCRHEEVTDVRGLGLALVIETSSFDAATRLRGRIEENGLLVRQQGQVLMAVPPLMVDNEGVAAIAERLYRSVAEDIGGRG